MPKITFLKTFSLGFSEIIPDTSINEWVKVLESFMENSYVQNEVKVSSIRIGGPLLFRTS